MNYWCWKWPTVTFPITSIFMRWISYLSPCLHSSGLLSAQILNWLSCGWLKDTCHCLWCYTIEQSTCRLHAVAGLWLAERYVSLSLMLHDRTVDMPAACSCCGQCQSLWSSRVWARNCITFAKAAARYRRTAADRRRGRVSIRNRRFRMTWRFITTWRFRTIWWLETTWQFRTTGSLHNLSLNNATEQLKWPPGQLTESQATDAAEGSFRSAPLCCACCYTHGDFLFYVHLLLC